MSTDSSLLGSEIAGHRIERMIGRGGGGAVYLAEHLQLGRKVALKLLPPELSADETFRQRFTWEARTAATLHHPSIVTVFDAGEADGVLFISMLHVDGVDLAQLLANEGPITPERTLAIVSKVALALDAAHERGFVHRDVKPANILIEETAEHGVPHVYLSDFGIAKPLHAVEGPTKTGEFVGTINYVAPEQIKAEPLDGRADQYSLACVIVECLTGEVPFPRELGVAVIYAHLDEPSPSLHERRPDLPVAIDGVVSRALSKAPEHRYENCGILIEAIREALDAPPGPPPSRGREVRKTVTVVCVDPMITTSLGEGQGGDIEAQGIEAMMDKASAIVERHGGSVERLPGAALIGIFGVPRVHEDDALRAVRAASELREAIEGLDPGFERDVTVTLRGRMALSTGSVIAQNTTSGKEIAAGEAINSATRLEQIAQPGEILLSDRTLSLVRDAVEADAVQERSLPSEPGTLSAHRLIRIVPDTPGIARRFDVPLIGRSRELATLEHAFDRCASDRTCHLMTVLGEAGVGKTRLVETLVHSLGDRARIVHGRCLSYGEGITFWPVLEVLNESAGIESLDPPEIVRTKLRTASHATEDPRVLARLEQALGLSDLAVAREEVFWAVRRFIEGLATQTPLLVAFDDLHWAEPTFLDLVEDLARRIRGVPILLLCQARPELLDGRPGWGGGKLNATSILLEPLPDEDIGALIDAILGDGELEPEVRSAITRVAGGMPLYVEQIIAMLVEQGSLIRDGATWLTTDGLQRLHLPASTSALISARIDSLQADERQLLERASLIGQVFEAEAVRQFSGLGTVQFDAALDGLIRKDLIGPASDELADEDGYRIIHILVVEAAYSRLTNEARAELHERFADWLERTANERAAEVDELVGYHLEQASRYRRELGANDVATDTLAERAANSLMVAGDRALGRRDVHAANGLLRRARSLVPETHPVAVNASGLLADALFDSGADLIVWNEVLEGLADRAHAIGDESTAARAIMVGVEFRAITEPRSLYSGIAEIEALLPTLGASGEEGALAEVLSQLALLRFWSGDGRGALEATTNAIEVGRRSNQTRSLSVAIDQSRAALMWGPMPTSEALSNAFDLYRDGLARGLMMPLLEEAIAVLYALRSDFGSALKWLELGRTTVNDLGLADSGHMGAEVGLLVGLYEEVETNMRVEFGKQEAMGRHAYLTSTLSFLTEALIGKGDLEEALETSRLAEGYCDPADVNGEASWSIDRAYVLGMLGRDLDDAERLALRASEIAGRTDNLWQRGEASFSVAHVLRSQGRVGESYLHLQEALRFFEAKEHLVRLDQVREELAKSRDGNADAT